MSEMENIVWGNRCLAPEVLAAYVDRGLSVTERETVETHLASCPQCLSLLAGVARTAAEVSDHTPSVSATADTRPRVAGRNLVGVLTAAAAVIAVLFVPSLLRPWADRDAGLVSLVETVSSERSVLGRLTGGFPHAPLGAPSAGGQDGRGAGSDRLVLIADKIRESFGERQTPSRLHAMGVSQLLLGRYDEAARSLLAASREQPDNAKYLNDVATVQLERARRGLRPDDLPRALAAADRARRLDPSLNEAWFNRALAISALSLTDQAKQAWTEYLSRDHSSPWATEARNRLTELARPTPAELWNGIEQGLNNGIDAAEADAAVRAQTTEARQYIEDTLLPAWSAAVERGESGATERDQIRVMADSMLRVAGDALYRDAVAAIDRGDATGSAARGALAAAHLDFAKGLSLLGEDRFAESSTALTAAQTAFTKAGSPMALRASTELGAIAYATGKSADVQGMLSAVSSTAQSSHYAYAAGRAAWLLGIAAYNRGQVATAQTYYEDMLATFDRMGDVEQAATAHGLLSGINRYFGDEDGAWQHQLIAFQALSVSRSPRFKFQLLMSAAYAVRAQNPDSALAIQDVVLQLAHDMGRSSAIVDILEQRASTLLSLGRRPEAEASLASARQELARIGDPKFRNLLEVQVLATESEINRTTNAELAVNAATRALDILQSRQDRPRVAQLSLKLAKADIAWGRIPEAEAALARGIKAFDDERATVSDEGRLSTTDESWQLFETAVQLALKKGDLPTAFAMAERARVRTLAEAKRLPAARSLKDVESSLADGEAIVALNQFDDELAIWLIKRNSTTAITRALNRRDADRLIARQHDEIRLEMQHPSSSAALYNEILKPLGDQLKGISRLVVVPDAAYQDVAFAGLWNTSKQRFLVEDYSVTLAPSASAFSAGGKHQPASDGGALIVGGPEEATLVASAYPLAQVLTGASATSSALFSNATGRSVIHVAARVTDNEAYPLLSRLTLADEPGRRYSGVVLGRDIAAGNFNSTRLVVLGDSDTTDRGDDTRGTLNVARAFLAAGVPNVLGTLPGMDETQSRDLILGFHRRLSTNASPAEALTSVQRSVLGTNGRRLGAWCALVLYSSDR